MVGRELVPHTGEAVAVFRLGQSQEARLWLEDYGSTSPKVEAAMEKINISRDSKNCGTNGASPGATTAGIVAVRPLGRDLHPRRWARWCYDFETIVT